MDKRERLQALLDLFNWTFIENADGQIKLFAKNGATYDYDNVDEALEDVLGYFDDDGY